MPGSRRTRRLEAFFAHAPFGLAVLDRELRFRRVNNALAAMDRVPLAEHDGRRVDAVFLDVNPELITALERVLETGQAIDGVAVTLRDPARPDKELRWIASVFSVDGDEGSASRLVAVVVREGSVQRQLEAKLDSMATRSQLLNEFYLAAVRRHTDEQEILELLAYQAADIVGDVCVVSLVRAGRVVPVAVYARNRDQTRFAERLMPYSDAIDDIRSDIPPVSDRTFVVPTVPDADYEAFVAAANPSFRPFLERYRVYAVISTPLRVEGRTVGSIYVGRTDRRRGHYTRDDVSFIEGLSLRASLVVENARAVLDRETLRRRAEIVAEFLEAVVERGHDEQTVLELLVAQSAQAVGDAAVVVTSKDGWLDMAAIDSTDEDLEAAIRQRFEGRRFAVEDRTEPSDAPEPIEMDAIDEEAADELPGFERAEALVASDEISPDELSGLDGVSGPEGMALREAIDGLSAGSVIAQPLLAAGKLAGALVLLRSEEAQPYDADEVDLIRNLAGRASLALDNVRTHAALADTAARLATILEESPVPTIEIDRSLHVRLWNRAAERMFGWSEDELVGEVLPIVPSDRTAEFVDIIGRALRGEVIRAYETVRQRRDGSQLQVAVYDAALRGADGELDTVILRMVDIDERKRLEAELHRTSETLRAILDASPLAIAAVDLDRRVTYWSHGAVAIYGWTADEVVGRVPPYMIPEEPDQLTPQLDRVARGESAMLEDVRRQTKSGDVINVRIFAGPIRDQYGTVVGMVGIHEDIREQRRLEAELFEARKMESVGRLAGGIAHDFNNILTAIIGFADLALTEASMPAVHSSLSTIRSSAERAAGLTQQLLAFSRRQMLQPQLLDPNEVVLHMETILRRLIGEQIELAISVMPRVGAIRVDRTQLEQVILNLALNARDAMPEGGRLVIRTAHVRFDETSLSRHFEMTPGDYVQISVSDTGTGMSDETKAHIFEPFFTTKDAGAGTGLGLATTWGIVKQSGGYIWVYSEPGRGSTFKLYFPAIPEDIVAAKPVSPVTGPRTGRILLVEDEPVLRELGRQILTRHGYEVTAVGDGEDALRVVERDDGQPAFELLLSDVVMPKMSGTELARRLRERHPGLRVVLMSGYAEEIAAGGVADASFVGKPFSPDTLIRTVDAVLSNRRRAGKRA